VPDDDALEGRVGGRLEDVVELDQVARHARHHVGSRWGKGRIGREGPVAVRDFPVHEHMGHPTVGDDLAEHKRATSLDEAQPGRGCAPVVGHEHVGFDEVALEQRVEVRGRDERGDRGVVQNEEAEAAGMDADGSA